MKKAFLLLASLPLIFPSLSRAYTLCYLWEDRFSQAPGSTLPGQASESGTIWDSAGPAGPGITVQAGNLVVPHLLAPQGNRVRLTGVNGPGARVALGSNVMASTLYYSLALRVADLGTLGPNGGTIAAFNNATGSIQTLPAPLAARLLVRSNAGGYQLGFSKSSTNGADFVWAPTTFSTTDVVFVVAAYEFRPEQGTALCSLWINPPAAQFGRSSAPTPTLTTSAGADISNIQSFVLVQRPGPVHPAVTFIDEIRVATIWPAVTPPGMDFGDAPEGAFPYPTTMVRNGARHGGGPLFFGPGKDLEADGIPTVLSDGDDITGVPNDETGIVFGGNWRPGGAAWVDITVSAPGRVDAWADWNQMSGWEVPEKIIASGFAGPGAPVRFNFPVPTGIPIGPTYARFRLSTAGELPPEGFSIDGEVQDYQITLTAATVGFGGSLHTALGHAAVSINSNGLHVANFGASGQDGVSIDLQELSRNVSVSMVPVDLSAHGSALGFTAYGTIEGTPERAFASVRFENSNGVVNVVMLDPRPGAVIRVEVYNGATLARSFGLAGSGSLGSFSNNLQLTGARMVADPTSQDAFMDWDSWRDFIYTPPGAPSVPVTGNRLRMIFVGSAGLIENLARVAVTGRDLPSLTIREENAPQFQPRLRTERTGQGLNIKWDTRSAVLQKAPTIHGPWTNVREGTNAMPVQASETSEFFRVQARPVEVPVPCLPIPGYVCKRNVLLIVVDDIGIDHIPAYIRYYAGTSLTSDDIINNTPANPITTPTLDNLANAGVTFLNAWSSPTCSPTRACLFSGQYSFRHGVYSPMNPDLPAGTRTIANVLKDSGYTTGLFGKWHLGDSTDYRPLEFGFNRYAGSLGGELTTSFYSWAKSDFAWTALGGGPTVPLGGTNITTTYATHMNVSDATNWIAGQTGPWMATITFNAAHWANNSAGHKHYEMPPAGCPYAVRANDGGLKTFRSMVECMDHSVADLLSGIDSNVLENTTIIFMGDNGTEGNVTGVQVGGALPTVTVTMSEHFTSLPGVTANHAKGTLYEGGLNVPLIVADGYSYVHPQEQSPWTKGLGRVDSPGRYEAAVVQTADLFTTIAKIGRGDASCGVDSISLLPYLNSSAAAPQRDVIFAETYNGTQWDVAVRGESFKLIIRNYCISPTSELYHLASDRWETTELLGKGSWLSVAPLISNILSNRLEALLAVPAVCPVTPVSPVPTVPCP